MSGALGFLPDVQQAIEQFFEDDVTLVNLGPETTNRETGQVERGDDETVWSGKGMVLPEGAPNPMAPALTLPPPGTTHRILLPLALPAEDVLLHQVIVGPHGRYVLLETPNRGTVTVLWSLAAREEK